MVLVAAAAMVAGFVGLIVEGIGVGLLLVATIPLVARVGLSILVQRRRAAFEAQLGETLTMISGGLRAGHSVLRAIDAVAQEASEPTATAGTSGTLREPGRAIRPSPKSLQRRERWP